MQELNKFTVPDNFRGKNIFVVQLWWFIRFVLFIPSPQFLYGWRNFLLRVFGSKIGKNVKIRPTAIITYPWNLTIGDFSWIGDDVKIYNLNHISIDKNSVISQEAYLCAGSHDYKSVDFKIISSPITVEEGVWIAARCFIHPGVTVKKNCVISACSNLKNSTKENSIYSGSPAMFIKTRLSEK